jgi:hypothetical protein
MDWPARSVGLLGDDALDFLPGMEDRFDDLMTLRTTFSCARRSVTFLGRAGGAMLGL